MKFTGERAIEGKTPEGIMQSHRVRYEFAANYCKGKDVLDISCGAGYGSAVLLQAGRADSVLGVDIDQNAIRYAQENYRLPGLSFQVGDILDLDHIDRQFDLIVCFETIEHVQAPRRALEQLSRLLRPDGLLILSTPNRMFNSPGVPYWEEPCNQYHIREFSRREFQALLRREFEIIAFFGQCILPGRWVLSLFARKVRQNIERWYLSPLCSTIRRLRFYEEAYYFVPICRVKKHSRPLWRRVASRIKRILRILFRG